MELIENRNFANPKFRTKFDLGVSIYALLAGVMILGYGVAQFVGLLESTRDPKSGFEITDVFILGFLPILLMLVGSGVVIRYVLLRQKEELLVHTGLISNGN